MKQTRHTNNESKDNHEDFDRLRLEFEGLPEPVRVRPIRRDRYRIRGGLPIEELERVSAMRVWEALAGIPADPKSPDDFEPVMPDQDRCGWCGE